MQSLSNFLVVYVLNAVWQVPLLVVATVCAVRLLRSARAVVIHRVWVGCLLLAVVLPATPMVRMGQGLGTREQGLGSRVQTLVGSLGSGVSASTQVPKGEGPGAPVLEAKRWGLRAGTLGGPEELCNCGRNTEILRFAQDEGFQRPHVQSEGFQGRYLQGERFQKLASSVQSLGVNSTTSKGERLWALAFAVRVLWGAYLLSLIFAVGRLVWGLSRTAVLVRRARVALLSEELQGVWDACCAGFGLEGVRLLCSAEVVSPATLTFWRPVVLLPNELRDAGGAEMSAAFCHELAHVRRVDFLKNVLYELVAVPLFFHPAMHWMRRRVQESRELACDDMAAEILDGRSAYAGRLVRLARAMHEAAAVPVGRALGVFEGNVLEKRVMNLIETKVKQAGWRVAMSVACGLLLLAGSCVVSARFGLKPVFAKVVSTTQPVVKAVAPVVSKASEAFVGAAKGVAPVVAVPVVAEPVVAPKEVVVATPMAGDLKEVRFKTGKTYFLPKDSITVDSVRGTSDKIEPGNLYEIRGHYTLASHEKALLAVNVTVSSRSVREYPGLDGQQQITVNKGAGQFVLWNYMRTPGDMHMSFYPDGGGESFAGIYFETDESHGPVVNTGLAQAAPKGWFLAGG